MPIDLSKKKQCPACGSYNTHTWNGTDGHSEPQSVFECYDCNLIIENGETIQPSKIRKGGTMTKEEKTDVKCSIDNEGFDYAFRSYSNFEEVKDEEFHKLRKVYIEAADALEKYINNQ